MCFMLCSFSVYNHFVRVPPQVAKWRPSSISISRVVVRIYHPASTPKSFIPIIINLSDFNAANPSPPPISPCVRQLKVARAAITPPKKGTTFLQHHYLHPSFSLDKFHLILHLPCHSLHAHSSGHLDPPPPPPPSSWAAKPCGRLRFVSVKMESFSIRNEESCSI